MVSIWKLETVWFTIFIVSLYWLQSKGQQTFHCEQDETVEVDVTSEDATIITRLSGESFYDDNLNCKWKITASSEGDTNRRIHVKVISSSLDYAPDGSNCNSYDFVAVKEDYMTDSAEEYYDWNEAKFGHFFTWCGNTNPGYFSSRDGVLVIEFQTNDRNRYDLSGVMMEVSSFEVGSCPPDWVEETSRTTNYCYKLRTNEETWSDAQDYCNKEQANLVSFMDNTEAEFVTDLIQNTEDLTRYEKVWIGLNDITVNGKYVWIDGIDSSASPRWKTTPHDADPYDNCVSVDHQDGLWQEEFCTEAEVQTVTKNKFVCKTNKDGAASLHLVPEDREEREGEGSSLPIPYIILGAVLGLLLLTAMVALLVYACKRKKAANTSYRSTPTNTGGGGRRGGNKDGISYTHHPPDDDEEPEVDDNPNFKAVLITCAAILLVIIIVLAVLLCAIFRRRQPRPKRRNQEGRRPSDTELQLNPVHPTPQGRASQPRRAEGMILLQEQNIRRQPSVPSAPVEEFNDNRRHSPPPTYHEAVNM